MPKCFFASAASSSVSFHCDSFPLRVTSPPPFPCLRQLETPGLTNALTVYCTTSCNCFASWLWVLVFLCYHFSLRIDRRVSEYAEASSTHFTTSAIFTSKQSAHKHNFCFNIMYNLSIVHFNVMRYYIVNMGMKTRSTTPPFYFVT